MPGVDIIRRGISEEVCVEAAAEIRARADVETTITIRNGTNLNACGKRRGVPMDGGWSVVRKLSQLLRGERELDGRIMSDASGLLRQRGCRYQEWHVDFPPFDPDSVVRKPRTAWVVLENGASLDIGLVPSYVACTLAAASLGVGDVVLFDGDVPHRGVAYSSRSVVSMHAYLDVPDVARMRDPHAHGSFHSVLGFPH